MPDTFAQRRKAARTASRSSAPFRGTTAFSADGAFSADAAAGRGAAPSVPSDGRDAIDRNVLVFEAQDKSIRNLESQLVARVLEETHWNISRSAAILGINRTTLYNKIRVYSLGKRPARARIGV